MIIKFSYNDLSVESYDFNLSTIDFIYEEYASRYIKKFVGQLPFTSSNDICQFLEQNSQDLFLVEAIDDEEQVFDVLANGRLFLISEDIINNHTRIEIRQEVE